MNADPTTIGYWARVCDLRFADVLTDGRFSEHLRSSGEQSCFRDGWATADEELLAERLSNLVARLQEVS